MKNSLPAGLTVIAGALICLLGGCSARSDVSLTGNTPSQYSHVWITTQDLWFNSSATAGPDDSGWTKLHLSNPATLDLVQMTGGTLGTIASDLKLLPGTYEQVRLIPIDALTPLTTSASDAGALYNSEADFVDSSGTTQQLPLELLNPDKGIAVAASLRVPLPGLGSSSVLGTTTGSTSTAATTGTATTAAATTSTNTTTASFTLTMDGVRDLVPFTYGTTAATGILLSSHAGAYDLSRVGGISGQLTLTNITNVSNIHATAESLSADGTRHVVVTSVPVQSDGTFTIYPLPTSTNTAAIYDVVIHGPGIATIIIKSVSVTLTTSATTASTDTTATVASTTTSTTTSDLAATTTPSTSTNTVSIGTLIPRPSTSTYAANIATATGSPLTADAVVNFYQTLTTSGEVPYVIEQATIDPFNQVLSNAVPLPTGTVDSGTYIATGNTIAVFSAAPKEKAGGYLVAAGAPFYADGPLTPTVTSAAPTATVAALQLASGNYTGEVLATITMATPNSTGGIYNQGVLLVSHNGALVSQASLNNVLTGGGTVSAVVPSGSPDSVYYVSVRLWSTSNPGAPVERQWYPYVIDMSGGGTGLVALTIN